MQEGKGGDWIVHQNIGAGSAHNTARCWKQKLRSWGSCLGCLLARTVGFTMGLVFMEIIV